MQSTPQVVFDEFGSISLPLQDKSSAPEISEWVQVFDEDKVFYYNKTTKQSTWILPEGVHAVKLASSDSLPADGTLSNVQEEPSIAASASPNLNVALHESNLESPPIRPGHPVSCGGQWIPDHFRTACVLCHSEFSFFRRRHHCRCCYDIFCSKCSDCIDKIRKCKPCQIKS